MDTCHPVKYSRRGTYRNIGGAADLVNPVSSFPNSLNVSLTQESSCSLPLKDNFYYYFHNTTYTLQFYILQLKIFINVLTILSLGVPI